LFGELFPLLFLAAGEASPEDFIASCSEENLHVGQLSANLTWSGSSSIVLFRKISFLTVRTSCYWFPILVRDNHALLDVLSTDWTVIHLFLLVGLLT
jgi:hypothetical protein